MNITVVALGKIGLPVAAWYASRGHSVTGCDVNPAVVDAVNRGESPITHEPGLTKMVRDAVAAGHLHATTDTTAGVRTADVVLVLVPLTIDGQHQPDYRPLDAAFAAIGKGVSPGALVILETTVAVGDTRTRFLPILEREFADRNRASTTENVPSSSRIAHPLLFSLAFSPERVQSGTIFRDLTAYPRVVGGTDRESGARAAAFYQQTFGVDVKLLRDAEAAEFCKLAESIYRDVNIALANELAQYAESCGVDAAEVFPVANSQPQSHLHTPGAGVGGHCIPVYPYLMIGRTPHSRLALAARHVNDAMPGHVVDLVEQHLGPLDGRRVLILGVSFRPGVREAAHSPALAIHAELIARGALSLAHDPLFAEEELRGLGLVPTNLRPPPPVDAIIIQTAHAEYHSLDLRCFVGLRLVVDGRAALDRTAVETAGITYAGIGRGGGAP